MADSLASLVSQRVQVWNRQNPSAKLDPSAVLAVAQQEGLSGGIGDSGHAFGPFQLNNAGGVITGKFSGQTPQQIEQWASSPSGIDYALAGIAKAAGGQTGTQAVNSIVSGFERPKNIPQEIQRANSSLGLFSSLPSQIPAKPIVAQVAAASAPQAKSSGMDSTTQALLEALLASHAANQSPLQIPTISPLPAQVANSPVVPPIPVQTPIQGLSLGSSLPTSPFVAPVASIYSSALK